MRFAICNETFQNWDHGRVCQAASEFGYQGLEIAPFTFARNVGDIDPKTRKTIRSQAEDAGLQIIGLHWLLAQTEGLQLTSSEAAVRKATADYLVELAGCCRDFGGDLMVFGSPAQRRIPSAATREQATDYAVDTLEQALGGIAEAGVRLCLEPLSPPEADFINTCDEALAIVDRLNHPNVLLHLDVKAMSTETTPTPDLIRKHGKRTGHFHANDPNLRGPGFGDADFVPIFQALKDSGYAGWVSVEVFDYSPDPETIARQSICYMKECEAKVG